MSKLMNIITGRAAVAAATAETVVPPPAAAATAETVVPPPAAAATAETVVPPPAAAAAATVVKADPAEVAQLCADRGVPHLAAGLIRDGATLDQVKERTANAEGIRGLVATAAKLNAAIDPKLADGFIAAGASLEHVRAQLFDRMVAGQSAGIDSAKSASTDAGGVNASTLWDTALKATTPKTPGS